MQREQLKRGATSPSFVLPFAWCICDANAQVQPQLTSGRVYHLA